MDDIYEKPLEKEEAIIILHEGDTLKIPEATITVPQGKWLEVRVKEPYEIIRKKEADN